MKKLVTCLLVVSTITACTSMAPNYEVPKIDSPTDFKELSPEKREQLSKWKPAEPGKVDSAAWWTKYNDPVLNDLEKQVLNSNLLIVQALESFNQAKALVRQAQSQWYPTIGLTPSFTGQRGLITGSTAITNYTTATVPITGSWAPDLWGKVAASVDESKAAAQVSEADLESVKLTQEVTVATTYFDLRAQDEMQRVLDDTVKDYEESERINDVLLRTGIGNEESLLQAQTQLLTARAQATNLHIARAQFEHAIALLVGQSASSFSIKVAPFNVVIPATPVGVPSQILQRRPDVAAAERNMASANAEIGVARSAFFPSLSISGSAGLEVIASIPAFVWSLGASLSQTLFDGGSRFATLDQFKAAYRLQVANYKQTVLTSFQQVEDQLAALHHLETEVHQQDAAVDASQKYVDIAQNRFKLGIDPYLTVVEAQITLLTNKESAVSIRLQQLVASAQLVEAVGGDWDSSKLSDGSNTDIIEEGQKISDEKADGKSAGILGPSASPSATITPNVGTAAVTGASASPDAWTAAPTTSPAAPTPAGVSPGASTVAPNGNPAAPAPTSVSPGASTVAPNGNPTAPAPTSVSPGASTVAPNGNPAAPAPTSVLPGASTVAPNGNPTATAPANDLPSASTVTPNGNPTAPAPASVSPGASTMAPNSSPTVIAPANDSPSASTVAPNGDSAATAPENVSPSVSTDTAASSDVKSDSKKD
jgi:NodT family efflux transporter outer membrane factor (OMF) lipoprotein